MSKKQIGECVAAVAKAAVVNGWECVLCLTVADVVEQLEETKTYDPKDAVEMYQSYVDCQSEME